VLNSKLKKVMIFGALIWTITNFHHPVTPSHFTNLGMPNHIFGTSYAMMVFTSFLTAPIWGSWGDRNSRMKVLFLSTFIYGIGQLGFGLSRSLGSILFFRGISGVANGGFSGGLMAAIVDTTIEENRGIAMSNYTAIMLVMTSIGFLIGGLLGDINPQYVIFIQAISMIIVSFGFIFIVGETNLKSNSYSDKKVVFIWDILRDAKNSKEVFSPWVVVFLGITFFIYIAQSSNVNAFNYYLKEQLDLKPIVNGVWKTVTGIVGLIANLTINAWIFRKKDILSSLVGIILLSVISGIMILLNTAIYPFMIWNLIFYTLITILIPILQNLAVEGDSRDVGFMSGIYNAIRALGEVFGSTVAGFTYNISSLAPFALAAGSLSIAFILSLIGRRSNQLKIRN
jgi:DHA1 family multidrug resistance protein-like MFS transporter